MTNKYLPKLKDKDSNCIKLLGFLQKNPDLEVAGEDFLKGKRAYPFLGQVPGARLSELLGCNLIDIVGKRKGKNKKTTWMNLYKINENGQKFILPK